MEAIPHVGLILILGVVLSLSNAFIVGGGIEVLNQINDCRLSHKVSEGPAYTCYDPKKLEECLAGIHSYYKEDLKLRDDMLTSARKLRDECPGFVGTATCKIRVSRQCKNSFTSKVDSGDASVCEDLQGVRDCLESKLKDSCVEEILQDELAYVQAVERSSCKVKQ